MLELLAPAGDPDKLKTALHFGADAVYLGLERLSMRATAGNFTLDELEWALGYAHERGRRVFVAVNVQPFDEDLTLVERTFGALARLAPDGVIVADPGVVALARRHAPALELHLLTQASVTNHLAARFWREQGVRRICVARELSLAQLAHLTGAAGCEIEAFVHGAVCVAWSGRCLMSLYWAKRDPRRGHCAQACRWRYRAWELEDGRRPGQANRVEEDERGTYFFDAKDLCALPLLDRLVASGVRSLKIEGRTRSQHYVGVVVDVYRHALDRLAAGDVAGFRALADRYLAELARPTNRGFSTHFLDGSVDLSAYNPAGSRPAHENHFFGKVIRRADDFLELELKNPLRPGDRVEIRDRGLVVEEVVVDELRTPDGERVAIGHAPGVVRLPGRFTAGPEALVRRALDAPEG